MGQRFTVTMVENLRVSSECGHLDILGLCDSDAQKIVLESLQGPDKLRETFLHEHLHAMVNLAGLRDVLTEDKDEDVIKRLTPILLQFLRDNPAVYAFLIGKSVAR